MKNLDSLEWGRLKEVPLDKIEHDQDLTKYLKTEQGKQKLRPIQNEMLWQAIDRKGLLGFVACGEGKTLVSLLLPSVLRAERPLLLLPAFMITQHLADREAYGAHWQLKEMKVLSYETLSSPKQIEALDTYKPDLIICDEAHSLKNRKSARVRRLDKYLVQNVNTHFCALSGTLCARSLSDYAHLSAWSLKVYSPLPRLPSIVEEWSLCIEEHVYSKPVYSVFGAKPTREALQTRLRSSKGIVITKSQEVGASLIIHKHKVDTPKSLTSAIQDALRTGDIISSTSEILDPLMLEHLMKSSDLWTPKDSFLLRVWGQLSCGFIYTWDWGNREVNKEWIEARRNWGRVAFQMLENSSFDSISHIATFAQSKQAPAKLRDAWYTWQSMQHIEPPSTREIWIDDYLIKFASYWLGQQDRPSIIWVQYTALANKLKEKLNIPYYGAGDQDAQLLEQNKHIAHNCIMSLSAHGTGKNLQAWSNQVLIHPLAHPSTWEQLLARTHRPGQQEDEVKFHVISGGLFGKAFYNAIKDAQYIQDTTGQNQRLIYATKI